MPTAELNTIPAEEIRRRGIDAVEELLAYGSVHVVDRNGPKYVIMTEERYQDLLEAEEEAILGRARAVEADIAAGRVKHLDTPEEIRAWVMQLGTDRKA